MKTNKEEALNVPGAPLYAVGAVNQAAAKLAPTAHVVSTKPVASAVRFRLSESTFVVFTIVFSFSFEFA